MLVGVIADTHMTGGRRKLPTACVERLGVCDLIVHAGDVMTEEALAEIEAIGPPVEAVLGNVDSFELRGRLPPELELRLPGDARLAVVHDAGHSAGRLRRLRLRFPDAHAVVFGHSHLPLHERDGDFQIFNPGSPTERRRAPHHSMGLARVEAGRIEFELLRL
jgi:putative phosphoesterase